MLIIVASVCQLEAHDWAKTVLPRGGVEHEVSHRPLISNDLGSQGPRLHGCVVLSRHSRLSEKQYAPPPPPPATLPGTETTFILWIK